MTRDDLLQLRVLLAQWDAMDFGDLPRYVTGEWTRHNLEAMCEDVTEALLHATR